MRGFSGVLVVAALSSAILVAPAQADLSKAQEKALVKSGKKSPKIADGALERRSAKRVTLTFDVRYPDLGLERETARVEVSVFKKRDGQLPLRTIRRPVAIPENRKAEVRIGIGGKAGKVLARAIAKGAGKRGPLGLVSIMLEHARDLYGNKDIDHLWRRNSRGRDLVGDKGAQRPEGGAHRGGAGSIFGASFTLHVQTGLDEAVRVSTGSLTCTNYAGGANGEAIGPGYADAVSTNVAEAIDKVVADNKGFASSAGTANVLPNPELRTFGYEAALQYGSIPPPNPAQPHDLRYGTQIGLLPGRAKPCLDGTHTFAVAADGAETGNHIAKIYQFKRHSTLSSQVDVSAFGNGTINAVGFADSLSRNGNLWTVEISDSGGGYPTLTSSCPDAGHWMECTFPKGSALEQTRLVDVTIPGSHDSSTYALGLALEESTTGGCSGGPGPANVLKNIPIATRNWAVTQRLSLREQLDAGIRYVDMRAAYDGSDWRPIHTLYSSDTLIQAQQMIANWAAQHPDEIVVADFNHICPLNGGTAASFVGDLQAPAPVTGRSLCDQAYDIVTPTQPLASNLATRTVADIRSGKGNVIVLLQDQGFNSGALAECGWATQGHANYSASPPIPPGVVPTYDAWPNQEGPGRASQNSYGSCSDSATATAANTNIREYPYADDPTTTYTGPLITDYKNQSPVSLLQTQMIYTLDFGSADNAITSGALVGGLDTCPDTLLEWGASLKEGGAPYTRADILAHWGNQTNMVITDDVTQAYISQAVNLNQ